MANRRSLHKRISLSEQVSDLSLKAALLFTWAIPHLDDWGRMAGAPRAVKAAVVPLREDITTNDVAACLAEPHEAGLIIWYTVDGQQYVQYPKFEEHQTNLHKRTASRLPPPPGHSPPSTPDGVPSPPAQPEPAGVQSPAEAQSAVSVEGSDWETPDGYVQICQCHEQHAPGSAPPEKDRAWLKDLLRRAGAVKVPWQTLLTIMREMQDAYQPKPGKPRIGGIRYYGPKWEEHIAEAALESLQPRQARPAPANYGDDGPPDDDDDPIAAKVRAQAAALARAAGHGA